MKIIFFGSSDFAVLSLKALIGSHHKILAAVTGPDKPKGRHLNIAPSPVKALAQEAKISIFQPEELNDSFVDVVKKLGADLFIVAAYGKILPKRILDAPKIFSINVHGSLLPKYRGAAPVNWALINGDRITGVTIIKMNEKLDEGEIILKEEIPIEKDDDALSLGEKLSKIGADLLLRALDLIEKKEFALLSQSKEASYAPKLKKEDGLIYWDTPAIAIHRRIRGVYSWPGSYTYYKGKMLKIHKAIVLDEKVKAQGNEGAVVKIDKNSGIVVQTKEGLLSITELQLEGGKKLDAWSFEVGHRLRVGDRFSLQP